MSLKSIFKDVGTFTDEHASEILKALGISGTLTALILAIKFTPRAVKAIETEKIKKNKDSLTILETIKVAGKYYIPCAAVELVSIGCFIGGEYINNKRTAALAAAYALSESALKTYSEKVLEVVGEKKEMAVRTLVDKKDVDAHPLTKTEIITTPTGKYLCFDPKSGRYFMSSRQIIKDAENRINRDLRTEMYIPLNELYFQIGLEPIDIGDLLGWNIDGTDTGYLDIKFTSQITDDGVPAAVMNYLVTPKYNYR